MILNYVPKNTIFVFIYLDVYRVQWRQFGDGEGEGVGEGEGERDRGPTR